MVLEYLLTQPRSLSRAWSRQEGLEKDEVAAARHEDCWLDGEDMMEAGEDEDMDEEAEDRVQEDNDEADLTKVEQEV